MSTLDEPLALFLNCFCQRIILLNLAQNWVELNVRDVVIFNRFWKQPPEWQVLYLSYWNSFFMLVLLPTLNAVHISPKKPAKLAVGAPAITPIPLKENRHTACIYSGR